MSKVLITKSKLDVLATSISAKTGETLPMTLDEMKDAVDDIIRGNDLEYGLTDGTMPLAGVAKAGSAIV